jgi:hypothetical protein
MLSALFFIGGSAQSFLILSIPFLIIGYQILQWFVERVGTDGAIFFHRQGFFIQTVNEFPLENIESVKTVVPPVGILFGFGTLIVFGNGGRAEIINYVRKPELWTKELLK